jgi:hypothetical protein
MLALSSDRAEDQLRSTDPADFVHGEAVLLKLVSQRDLGSSGGPRRQNQRPTGFENAAELR